jgi:ubiquitin-like domain-containing CTD phosphatase 1
VVERPLEMMRPYLHDFLASAYTEGGYDIIIWSATSLSWVELKMAEMGVTKSSRFKVAALVDRGAMITVDHPAYGRVDVKPLPVLWGLMRAAGGPAHGPHNTIMFDDLRRNFLANPTSGLRITAW